MTGSMGSSSSRLCSTVSLAMTYLMISSMADQMMKVSVVVLAAVRSHRSCVFRYEAANFSIGITTATATIPARKASAMSRRGSGGTLSSRRQNHSQARAGSTPPAKAAMMGSSSDMDELYPTREHSYVEFCQWQQHIVCVGIYPPSDSVHFPTSRTPTDMRCILILRIFL